MSLINNMLNALEKNKREESNPDKILANIKPITRKHQASSSRQSIYLLIILLIILGTVLYYNPNLGKDLKQLATNLKSKPSPHLQETSPKKEIDIKIESENILESDQANTEPETIQLQLIKLQNITVNRKENQTFLSFALSGATQYNIDNSLPQRLVVTLENTSINGNLPVSLENTFIATLNTTQNQNSIIITANLLPGTEVEKTLLIDEPQPHLQLTLSNAQLTKGSMTKSLAKLAPEQQAERNYLEIQKTISENKIPEAIRKLRMFIGDFPNNLEARGLLASLLINSGQLQSANSVLVIGLNKHPNYIPFIKLKAYLLIKQDMIANAIKLLEKHLSQTDDMEYTALLAALYQKNGEFMEAAHIYNRLAKKQPQNTAWWVGLGLALESADKHNAAQEAYLRAYNNSDVPPELAAFLNDKIKK